MLRKALGKRPAGSGGVGAGFELLDRHEDGAGLRTLRGADDAAALHEVHEPSGPGEPDPELALQHGGGAEAAADDQLDGLAEEVVAVVVGGTTSGPVATGIVGLGDALHVGG